MAATVGISVARILGVFAALFGLLGALAAIDCNSDRRTRIVGDLWLIDTDGSNQFINGQAANGKGVMVSWITAYGLDQGRVLVETKFYDPEKIRRDKGRWGCEYGVLDPGTAAVSWAVRDSSQEREIRRRLKDHGTIVLLKSCVDPR